MSQQTRMVNGSAFEFLRSIIPTISVGVNAADVMQLDSELALLEQTDVELAHFDVMDGCFTPMMTVGAPFIKSVRTLLLKDVHLMIEEPLEKVDAYVAAGADIITVHAESSIHLHRVFQKLGGMQNVNDPARGLIRGIALNPGTPLNVIDPLLDEVELVMLLGINPGWGGQLFIPSTFSRVAELRKMIAAREKDVLICVDGGITKTNISDMAGVDIDVVVTGSAVYDGKDPVENARFMIERLQAK
ncbi:MAG: ribulose-phosphate 3-epimerase [Acidobacteriota bacterium]|nr:ribulose-phosphate 3-epimerase [Acidobacteriota bacterium]